MQKRIILYSTPRCRDCHAARDFLNQHHVEYEEVNIEEEPDAAKLVMQMNKGKRSIPTFNIEGTYINCSPFTPDNRKKLAKAIGVKSTES
jgi:mycoredoxin